MRMRERGIGNLPFIAVIVLLVLALALWFMAKDEADNLRGQRDKAKQAAAQADDQLVSASNAFDALVEVTGWTYPELQHTKTVYPAPDKIKDKIRTELYKQVEDIQKSSEAKLRARQYTIDKSNNQVRVTEGDPTVIQLYGTGLVRETVTVQGILNPLASQFNYAAKAVEKNNELFEQEFKNYTSRMSQHQTKITDLASKYDTDVASKQQQFDTEKSRADDMQDQVNSLSATNDSLQVMASKVKTDSDRTIALLERERNAWKNRAIAEKVRKELALAEDPKDGEVLVADQRRGLVFINRGRRHKVSRGTRFTVWRPGKGNIREDIARVRVINVDDTKSTARILEWINRRVPVAQGMNISNPFYDPYKKLRCYIYGDLRTYPTDVAKRRLAESGVTVANRLDESIDIIVLGEPPVTLGEDIEDEAEAEAAAKRQTMERDRRLREIMNKAISIGAIVVNERVLRTFIEY